MKKIITVVLKSYIHYDNILFNMLGLTATANFQASAQ